MNQILTALRFFYRTHLSRFRWARHARNGLVNAIFATRPLWSLWLTWAIRRTGKDRSYLLRALPSADPVLIRRRQLLHPREQISLAWPMVWRDGYAQPALGGGGRCAYVWPDIELFELPRAAVAGRTDFVFTNGYALHHPLFKPLQHATSEELHFLGAFTPSRLRYVRAKPQRPALQLRAAIALLGSCTPNYVHWLTETLPQLLLADLVPELRDLPVLVDAGLHPNLRASISAFAPARTTPAELAPGQMAEVDQLFVFGATSFVPFDYHTSMFRRRPEVLGREDAARFSPFALRLLRKRADTLFGEPAAPRRRLLLRRRSGMRSVVNFEELEAALRPEGFEVVEPERLNFLEQLALFRTAAVVVAQTGAGLGNLLFAPRGCRAITLIARSPHSNYHYYSNLAQLAGLELLYVEGESADASAWHPAHADYRIDPGQVLEAVERSSRWQN